ncbi:MAG: polymer-forming cytoskeletal protein [Clostridia bacterium]
MINKYQSDKNREQKVSSNIESFIGPNTYVEGDIKFKGDTLKIDGKVSGKIESDDSSVIIGDQGDVNASIIANKLVIAGKVHGNITVKNIIDLKSSGSIDGLIKSKRIKVAEGAILDGEIEIGSN